VISNDKLRSQFGNLKMKEAFSKADDVLTTAARCITDVINANGHINVDFADVCTVMRNGGVAILGSATAAGENRAIKAIEAATNSPLLNDNDIRGAKWILLNISSAEGEYEYTMEELEAIQNYVREQSGDDTDVIMGMGYDENLGDQLGVTIIATGFDHKDPFEKASAVKTASPKAMPVAEPQIVLTLDMNATEAKTEEVFFHKPTEVAPAAPVVNEETAEVFTLETPELTAAVAAPATPEVETEEEETIVAMAPETIAPETTVMETLRAVEEEPTMPFMFELQVEDVPTVIPPAVEEVKEEVVIPTPGFLNRPAQIYAETPAVQKEETPAEENVMPTMQEMPEVEVPAAPVAPIVTETPVEPWKPTLQEEYNEEAAAVSGISLSFEESTSPVAEHGQISMFDNSSAQDLSEDEEQKRRAKERINRLRNLSYNPSHLDTNSEFEQVPAYLRRDMNLHNSIANVEDFYSRAQVKSDDNNQATISTLNNFLHGEKPD
jgi:cell division protein FtsZ